jgi:hypothetical protein
MTINHGTIVKSTNNLIMFLILGSLKPKNLNIMGFIHLINDSNECPIKS